ncbi:glycine betaine/L-proline ABC transporter ATP-binding protein ProV [Paenalcaligenes niemegkensis]|uniref:glycine betaine/L-proline ABC transporter ATP-binding protein ProV n=1 Tax=Paenalcaligenes niemegkensis TaxID=2895469 RepID=UPI001EE89C59|nr:glycine betaine/L-proline ABC transporter ATP-binding protein ProV [Paenalcaligenes niemegkensis]MCQ9617672.1 glycine betaine/L-proline ABC transporter ATP-binding protein ProV [Paenalcaligenes niemegkensis]
MEAVHQPEALVVKNLYKVFGAQPQQAMEIISNDEDKDEILARTGCTLAVNDVSLSIYEKEIFVVMGLSGSGKSTLARLLNRLIEPTAGNVYFKGVDILAMNDVELREFRRKHISMVFQSFSLMPHMNVLKNVGFGLELAGVSKEEREEQARDALKRVGLEAWEGKYPHELSGGMQQRVGLARALTNNPSILLMDEAFSALDPLIRAEMQDELLRLQEKDRRTIVFISHDIEEAVKIGDRIAIMQNGSLVQVGTPEEIIKNPVNDYVRSFFKTVNMTKVLSAADVASEVKRLVSIDPLESVKEIEHELEDELALYVVCPEGKYRGLVSRSSVHAALAHSEFATVSDAFVLDSKAVAEKTVVSKLFGVLASCSHELPIIDANGSLKGVVRQSDVFKLLSNRDAEAI